MFIFAHFINCIGSICIYKVIIEIGDCREYK